MFISKYKLKLSNNIHTGLNVFAKQLILYTVDFNAYQYIYD